MLQLPKDRPVVDVMKKHVKFFGLIRKPPIVNEDILNSTATLQLISHPNG